MRAALILLVFLLLPLVIVMPVSGADAYYEGYLGDVVDIHGVSYVGNQVYLFFTGPGLPANGVTLSDPTQRADQGHFTIIGVDSNNQWSYKWDTQRIQTQIDPGTYTVYVTTDPVDLAHLGGTSTYQTLEVYLANTHAPQGESGTGTYTLNPEKHSSPSMTLPTLVMGTSNVTPEVTPANTLPSPSPTTAITAETNTLITTSSTNATATQAALCPAPAIIAVIFIAGITAFRRCRR